MNEKLTAMLQTLPEFLFKSQNRVTRDHSKFVFVST